MSISAKALNNNMPPQKNMGESVLIVDDTLDNIRLLSDCLKAHYAVFAANNGDKALAIASRFKPDLILLDIMMPGMNGYEVCEKLKSSPDTSYIPIIFLTALHEADDEYKGLNLGAVDYICKPFNPHVLLSRISTHLKLKKAQYQLQQHNRNLEQLVESRSRELAEAHERLKVLDSARQDFLKVISHELRTPVNGVLGFAELAFANMDLSSDKEQHYHYFQEARDRLTQTLDDALLLAELQNQDNQPNLEQLNIAALLQEAVDVIDNRTVEKNITINLSQVDIAWVQVNQSLLLSSLNTLFRAGIILAHADSTIQVKGLGIGNDYKMQILINGSHLSDAVLDSFFDVFSTQRNNSYMEKLGLSIPLASRIIESLGGTIAIANADPDTIELRIKLISTL